GALAGAAGLAGWGDGPPPPPPRCAAERRAARCRRRWTNAPSRPQPAGKLSKLRPRRTQQAALLAVLLACLVRTASAAIAWPAGCPSNNTLAGDGLCNFQNNVAGCWDGGDCCAQTVRGGGSTFNDSCSHDDDVSVDFALL